MHFGVLNVRKPAGITSRDVVNHIVRCCPRKTKVGHAGTLDPMATGVLVVAVGPATKLIQFSQDSNKVYVGKFQLGLRSNTEDITGVVEEVPGAPAISEDSLRQTLGQFHGTILQTPPQFSAVKVDGKRAYQLARQGETAAIQPRPTRIDSIELLSFNYPNFSLEIHCGKGTYIRTLGRDIAKSVGSDAVMTQLERTAVGEFKIESALTLEDIEQQDLGAKLADPLLMVGSLNRIELNESEIERLRHGKLLRSKDWKIDAKDSELAAVSDNRLAAILTRKSLDEFATKVNFVPQLFA